MGWLSNIFGKGRETEKAGMVNSDLSHDEFQTDETISEKRQQKSERSPLLVGPKTPRPISLRNDQPKSGQLSAPKLGKTSIELSDGTIIQLSDIKKVSDCDLVLGAPNHPLVRAIKAEIELGYGVVYLLFVSENGPSSAVIPMENRTAAIAFAERIEIAKSSLKKQFSTRVIVGECLKCHRKLRVRERAVKPEMKLTCKCGEQNMVHVLEKGQ